MLISHRYKFIYLKARKVAGTSVESFLQRYCLSPKDEKKYECVHKTQKIVNKFGIVGTRMFKNDNVWYNHKPASDIKNDIGDEIFNEYTKIANIRNPYDMVVSLYRFNGNSAVSKEKFNEFLKKPKIIKTLKENSNIWGLNGELDFEYIRFENLLEDLTRICKNLELPISNMKIPHYKQTKRVDYRKYYNKESREIIEEIYKKELEHFGYEF